MSSAFVVLPEPVGDLSRPGPQRGQYAPGIPVFFRGPSLLN